MAQADLNARVTALEAEISKLKERVEKSDQSDKTPWWERISGTFRDDPVYEEAMKLGREYRESLRPGPIRKRKK